MRMRVSSGDNVAVLTDRGLRRAKNEDAVLADTLPGGALVLAVADGVGGARDGDVASTETIKVLREEFSGGRLSDPAAALRRAFDKANQRIRTLSGDGDRMGMATTLVAALVTDGRAWIANVGDSRASLVQNGRVQQLTKDHSFVAEQVEAGVLTDEEAEQSEYRNVITRAVGIDETIEPDIIGPIQLPADSVLMLYSDGLYRVVSDAEIAEVASLSDAASAADRLISMANDAGGPDNISVAIYRPN